MFPFAGKLFWVVFFFFILIINKAEVPYYGFVVRVKFAPKHVNDKIVVGQIGPFCLSLSPTRMSLFP